MSNLITRVGLKGTPLPAISGSLNAMTKALAIICLFLYSSCSRQIVNPKKYTYLKPAEINDNIPVRDISQYVIDTTLIQRLNKDLIDEEIYNVHSVLIYKDGVLF